MAHESTTDSEVRIGSAGAWVGPDRRRVSWIAAGVLSLAGCGVLPTRSALSSASADRWSGIAGPGDLSGSMHPGRGPSQPDFISGCRLVDGRMGVARVAADGTLRWVRPLAARVHEVLMDPAHACLHVIARRPGRERWCLSVADGAILERGDSGPEHVFCGHGIATRDGLLFTTEARRLDGAGSIAVRESVGGRLLTRFDCHGFDPHMISLIPDGNTVVVAIGGAREHEGDVTKGGGGIPPRSSLAYFDRRDGRCLGRYQAWHPRLSIRHLGVAPDGRVVFGTQWRGAAASIDPTVPLLGSHRGEDAPRPVLGEARQWRALRGYVGSVAMTEDGAVAWASSPRGGRVLRWLVGVNRLDADDWQLHDVCGVAVPRGSRQPLFSTGDGLLMLAQARTAAGRASAPVAAWDNHMMSLGRRATRPW